MSCPHCKDHMFREAYSRGEQPKPCWSCFKELLTKVREIHAMLEASRQPVAVDNPHPDGCHTMADNALADCQSDGHFSCRTCSRNENTATLRKLVQP